MSILQNINGVEDLRKLDNDELSSLAEQIRQYIIEVVSKNGGHLGANLGTVELSIAIHKIFNTPHDKLVWDVGHQAYTHKILTGRREAFKKIRTEGGISGFPQINESIFDNFGTAHASTALSAALGMAKARDLSKQEYEVICVAGDGSMSGGMTLEAMNNAVSLNSRIIMVLNDNDMSISKPVGAISNYLSKIITSENWFKIRNMAVDAVRVLPTGVVNQFSRLEKLTKSVFVGGGLFEALGFYYIGPVDGHNLKVLLKVFENIKNIRSNKPILLHVVTTKGKGYSFAENSSDKFHGVSSFNIVTGKKSKQNGIAYNKVFSNTLVNLAKKDDKIIAISAAMIEGTGLTKFKEKFPNRTFDVGIAEQHAVTFAAGLSVSGYKPFVCIYSTFLQRGMDQVIHDVAMQNLPVIFAIDRAGHVGSDGYTHTGAYDITYLIAIANMTVILPSSAQMLEKAVYTASKHHLGPISFRYPKDIVETNFSFALNYSNLTIGRAEIVKKGEKVLIISAGTVLKEVLAAVEDLCNNGINPTVLDLIFAKPMDRDQIFAQVKKHKYIFIVEEGSRGGVGAAILEILSEVNLLNNKKFKLIHFPDRFIIHASRARQNIIAKLDRLSIFNKVIATLKEEQ